MNLEKQWVKKGVRHYQRRVMIKMKPGKNDIAISLKIEGLQLSELQKHTWQMAEAFGLDRKVENYKGTRAMKFYQWDVECLLAVLSMALDDERDYPDKQDESYIELYKLFQKLKDLYEKTYKQKRGQAPLVR